MWYRRVGMKNLPLGKIARKSKSLSTSSPSTPNRSQIAMNNPDTPPNQQDIDAPRDEEWEWTGCSGSSDAEKYAEPHGSKERVEEQLRVALNGHSDSELWGEHGLIAATMRCVEAIEKIDAPQRLVSRYLRGSHGCRESALERMISDLWRNYPERPRTFGPCSEGCGGSGRGSGPCADCIERAIGLLAGQPMAACGLHIAIHKTREEARKLRDLISSANDKAQATLPKNQQHEDQ